jgi:hypothetical protein
MCGQKVGQLVRENKQMSCVQWYWPFVAGVLTSQLTEAGMLSQVFKWVLPPSLYASAYVVLNMSKLVCNHLANSCRKNCFKRELPSAPPRTFDFGEPKDADDVSEEDEDESMNESLNESMDEVMSDGKKE